jgi:hypothetical protein
MAGDGSIFCTRCGHQHESRPPDDICRGCGVSFVVDLANPSRSEVLRAVHTKPSRPALTSGLVGAGVVLLSVGLVVFFLQGRRCSEHRPSEASASKPAKRPPPGVIGLVRGELTAEQLAERRAIGVSLTEGPLNRESIQAVITHNFGAIQRCYEERLLEDSTLAGKVVMEWTVGPDGGVRDVEAASSDLSDPAVSGCMIEVVQSWRFPAAPPEGLEVNYPFIFASRGF